MDRGHIPSHGVPTYLGLVQVGGDRFRILKLVLHTHLLSGYN
jgi:hypothetical protein